ncbi:MAG TPA: hypothetical protein VFK02_04245, partial [Kofleriaceae bacterium]|nr:hypothetical protein [Kofleriaceae bacterium]
MPESPSGVSSGHGAAGPSDRGDPAGSAASDAPGATADAPSAIDLPATFGKYYLTEKLATGGMAEIYLAKIVGPGGFEK